jgi:hypothetical protein
MYYDDVSDDDSSEGDKYPYLDYTEIDTIQVLTCIESANSVAHIQLFVLLLLLLQILGCWHCCCVCGTASSITKGKDEPQHYRMNNQGRVLYLRER